MSSVKILPGTQFPRGIVLPLVSGGTTDLSTSGRQKLVVIYRGQFCPFCQGTLQGVQAKLAALAEAGVDVVAVSADPIEVSRAFAAEKVSDLVHAHSLHLSLTLLSPGPHLPHRRWSDCGQHEDPGPVCV